MFLQISLKISSKWKFIEFSGLFHCLIIKVVLFLFTVCPTACLVYHIYFCLSSTFLKTFYFYFLVFFKQLLYSIIQFFACQVFFYFYFHSFATASIVYHVQFCLSSTFLNFIFIIYLKLTFQQTASTFYHILNCLSSIFSKLF